VWVPHPYWGWFTKGWQVARTLRLGKIWVPHTSVLRVGLLTLILVFASHPQKPFNGPNSRSTLIFDHSL